MHTRGRRVCLIVCSDLHLSHKAPVFRSDEPNWYEAQKRTLHQLDYFQRNSGGCPIIIAGDIFDKWNSPAELINFAMEYLPENTFAIPGQHDLPYHDYSSIERSAYWTLHCSGAIKNLHPAKCQILDSYYPFRVHSYPWGYPLVPNPSKNEEGFDVAVVHQYVWCNKHGYPSAPKQAHAINLKEVASTYDVCIFGDNHNPFVIQDSKHIIVNNGTMMCRKSDEIKYKPGFTVILDDGNVDRILFDTTQDVYLDPIKVIQQIEESELGLDSFFDELQSMETIGFDFQDVLARYLAEKKLGRRTRQILMEITENELS